MICKLRPYHIRNKWQKCKTFQLIQENNESQQKYRSGNCRAAIVFSTNISVTTG